MNERKIQRVAEAICRAACLPRDCEICIDGKCQMIDQFSHEAVSAIKAMKGF